MKRQELDSKLKESLEELANETNKANLNEKIINFLNFSSQFHKYSVSNLWLIYSHKPNATLVAGYKKWKDFGRHVKSGKGTGIPIYAPFFKKEENDDGKMVKVLKGFFVTYVWDVSDTEGEPLPEPPNWKSPQKQEELATKLRAFCKGKNITVETVELDGEIQGVSKKGKILLSPDAGVKTLIHEIAHELMHWDKESEIPARIKELEAESCAYVVAKHFGIDNLQSSNYIALKNNKGEEILKHFKRILEPAIEIIKFIDPEENRKAIVNDEEIDC